MPEPLRQYVILCHSQAEGEHWDLMLDVGEVLSTWQLATDPATLADPLPGPAIPARRIADHRRSYLDYEGPVSGGRGSVKRVDKGYYSSISTPAGGWMLEMKGTLLRGRYRLAAGPREGLDSFQRVET